MAVEREFQALTLAEAQEEIQAYEAQSHKPIQRRGWPKAMKLSSPGFVKAPIRLHYSPGEFVRGGTNVIKFQDRLPWPGVPLLLVNSFLEGSRISHGGKTLTSWDIIQRTASLKPALLGKDKTGSSREPLTAI